MAASATDPDRFRPTITLLVRRLEDDFFFAPEVAAGLLAALVVGFVVERAVDFLVTTSFFVTVFLLPALDFFLAREVDLPRAGRFLAVFFFVTRPLVTRFFFVRLTAERDFFLVTFFLATPRASHTIYSRKTLPAKQLRSWLIVNSAIVGTAIPFVNASWVCRPALLLRFFEASHSAVAPGSQA